MSVPDFSQWFVESNGQPITYQGKTLIMMDQIEAEYGDRFEVVIESTLSKHPQGVAISEGVEVFGKQVERAIIWEYLSVPPENRLHTRSRLPFKFEVICRNRSGSLFFYNMTEIDGERSWWLGGSCMLPRDIENGKRYFCNDVALDDDFDDMIFTVTKIG